MVMTDNILPDSRLVQPTGVVRGSAGPVPSTNWQPIYCANCGAEGGMVPAENMTFCFWLCRKCEVTCVEIAGTMSMPDEVFWEKLKHEQLEAHGRFLTEQELIQVVEADASPLSTLIKEGR